MDESRRKTETDKVRAEQHTEFMTGIATKLAGDGQLEVPKDVAETAVFSGQLHRMARDFEKKLGGKPPPEGTPEAIIYHREMDELTTGFAAMMKSFQANGIEEVVQKPASIANFQSLQLYGSLGLNATQWQQLDGVLNRYYAEGFNRNLEAASQPAAGVEVWREQRDALSQRAFNQVQGMLTPQQSADFDRLYKPTFLWTITIGGQ